MQFVSYGTHLLLSNTGFYFLVVKSGAKRLFVIGSSAEIGATLMSLRLFAVHLKMFFAHSVFATHSRFNREVYYISKKNTLVAVIGFLY